VKLHGDDPLELRPRALELELDRLDPERFRVELEAAQLSPETAARIVAALVQDRAHSDPPHGARDAASGPVVADGPGPRPTSRRRLEPWENGS
jgi:hypothetical protein